MTSVIPVVAPVVVILVSAVISVLIRRPPPTCQVQSCFKMGAKMVNSALPVVEPVTWAETTPPWEVAINHEVIPVEMVGIWDAGVNILEVLSDVLLPVKNSAPSAQRFIMAALETTPSVNIHHMIRFGVLGLAICARRDAPHQGDSP